MTRLVADAKQKYVFLNSLGRKHYNLLPNLLISAEPEDKSLDELNTVLTKHFQHTTSVITEQYSFHCRCQIPNESIANFVVGLKKSITCCQYEPQVQSILLRDRFVCGLAHETTRKRLLTEDNDLMFDQAVEIATSVERASVQARQKKMSDSKVSVNQVKGKQQTSYPFNPPKVCYHCGGPHLAIMCPFVHETCRACDKTGHIARVCQSKRSEHGTSSRGSGSSRTDPRNRTHLLEVYNLISDPSPRTTSNPSSSTTVFSRSKPFTMSIMINNHSVPMELDTGASVSVISKSTYNTVLKDTVPLESTDISLRMYMGKELPVLGVATVAVSYESQTTLLPLVVIKGDKASLFGRNWLEHIKLNWPVIHRVSNNREVDDLLQKHQQLFLKGMEA